MSCEMVLFRLRRNCELKLYERYAEHNSEVLGSCKCIMKFSKFLTYKILELYVGFIRMTA